MSEMLARWLFSFAASCYIVAALGILPPWMATWGLSPPAFWAAYLLAELVVFGALVTLTLWWFLWRPGAEHKRYPPSRFAGLTGIALAPLFAVFVIPIGCLVSIPGPGGAIAALSVWVVSAIAFFAARAYSRSARR